MHRILITLGAERSGLETISYHSHYAVKSEFFSSMSSCVVETSTMENQSLVVPNFHVIGKSKFIHSHYFHNGIIYHLEYKNFIYSSFVICSSVGVLCINRKSHLAPMELTWTPPWGLATPVKCS